MADLLRGMEIPAGAWVKRDSTSSDGRCIAGTWYEVVYRKPALCEDLIIRTGTDPHSPRITKFFSEMSLTNPKSTHLFPIY